MANNRNTTTLIKNAFLHYGFERDYRNSFIRLD